MNNFKNTIYNLGARDNLAITTQHIAEILCNEHENSEKMPVPTIKQTQDIENGNIVHNMDSSALFNILEWQPEITTVQSIVCRKSVLEMEHLK